LTILFLRLHVLVHFPWSELSLYGGVIGAAGGSELGMWIIESQVECLLLNGCLFSDPGGEAAFSSCTLFSASCTPQGRCRPSTKKKQKQQFRVHTLECSHIIFPDTMSLSHLVSGVQSLVLYRCLHGATIQRLVDSGMTPTRLVLDECRLSDPGVSLALERFFVRVSLEHVEVHSCTITPQMALGLLSALCHTPPVPVLRVLVWFQPLWDGCAVFLPPATLTTTNAMEKKKEINSLWIRDMARALWSCYTLRRVELLFPPPSTFCSSGRVQQPQKVECVRLGEKTLHRAVGRHCSQSHTLVLCVAHARRLARARSNTTPFLTVDLLHALQQMLGPDSCTCTT